MMKRWLYDWNGLNQALFYWINGIDGVVHDRTVQLGTLVSNFRNFPYYLCAIVLCGLWRIRRGEEKAEFGTELRQAWVRAIAVFCLACVIDAMLVVWLKAFFVYPRPPLALPPDSLRILGAPEYRLSFPSGHASFALVLVASLWPILSNAWRTCSVLFVAWVGLSRIGVGAHFPADIAGSFILALPLVIIVRRGVERFSRHLQAFVEPFFSRKGHS